MPSCLIAGVVVGGPQSFSRLNRKQNILKATYWNSSPSSAHPGFAPKIRERGALLRRAYWLGEGVQHTSAGTKRQFPVVLEDSTQRTPSILSQQHFALGMAGLHVRCDCCCCGWSSAMTPSSARWKINYKSAQIGNCSPREQHIVLVLLAASN